MVRIAFPLDALLTCLLSVDLVGVLGASDAIAFISWGWLRCAFVGVAPSDLAVIYMLGGSVFSILALGRIVA